jgi:ABC-type phosphate transport system auxiliary subunit
VPVVLPVLYTARGRSNVCSGCRGLVSAQPVVQVRKRYAEMFNAVFYVLCIIREALNQMKVKHDEMASNWEDMEQQLRVARAKAAMEKRLREESLQNVEAEREELQQLAGTLKDEMATVRKENEVRITDPRDIRLELFGLLSFQ